MPVPAQTAALPAEREQGFARHAARCERPSAYQRAGHLDDLGIIHMNGRLYDPHIARMMQADPIIAGLVDAQYFNRYSYVFNRPTSLTDATGECPVCFWVIGAALFARAVGIIDTKTLRTILSIAVAPIIGPQAGILFNTTNLAFQAAVAGFVSGAIQTGSLKGAVQGMASALLTYGAGQLADLGGAFSAAQNSVGRALVHAGAGCINAQLSGGSCGRGALTAGVSQYLSSNLPGAKVKDPSIGTLRSAVIGGTVSVLGGGKFANGAVTGAFQFLYNDWVHAWKGTLAQRGLYEAELKSRGFGYNTYSTKASGGYGFVDYTKETAGLVGDGYELKPYAHQFDEAKYSEATSQLKDYEAVRPGDTNAIFQGRSSIQVNNVSAWWAPNSYDFEYTPDQKGTQSGLLFWHETDNLLDRTARQLQNSLNDRVNHMLMGPFPPKDRDTRLP